MDNSPAHSVAQPSGNFSTAVNNASDRTLSQSGHDHQRLADRLEDLAIELRSITDRNVEPIPSNATFVSLAKRIYGARRLVDEVFGMEGFAVSPAWDMMLDLYQARIEGKRISITSACIGGACPPTTGLRWLQALENQKLVKREADPNDGRRQVVELTDGAMVKVEIALAPYL